MAKLCDSCDVRFISVEFMCPHSDGEYSRCFGCCCCSLATGVLMFSILTILSGVGDITAGIPLLDTGNGWVHLIVGCIYTGLGIYAVVAVCRKTSKGIRCLSLVYKIGLVGFIVYDVFLIIDIIVLAANHELNEEEWIALIPVFAVHIGYYISVYFLLGTIKSLANVIDAGGSGNEFKSAVELQSAV